MAVLDATGRARTVAQFMREFTTANLGSAAFSKASLAAAVAAADDWVEANTASFNSALPAAFRTGAASATTAQKTLLLAYVLMRRMGKLHAEEDG